MQISIDTTILQTKNVRAMVKSQGNNWGLLSNMLE